MPQSFDTPLYSSDQSINRVLKAGLPVVLVFLDQAASAVPAALDTGMKRIASENAGRLLVVQLQVRDSAEIARRLNVSSTPALVTFKDGRAVSQAGNIQGDDLARHANYLLGKGPKPEQAAQPPPVSAGAAATDRTPAASVGTPITVTDATFEQEVMRSPVPVVVDFWAPWCGPCKIVAPTLDKLAREWNGRVKIAKVNVDENPVIAGQYGVSGIPTMMVVRNGKIVDRWAGAMPEPTLRSRLASSVM